MCTRNGCRAVTVVALLFASSAAFAQSPNLGTPISEADIRAWDISISPDGKGLPPGSGTPEQGARIFAAKCAVCHGENGKGGTSAALVGGAPLTNGIETTKTIANFWPYATTLFDFTRRAMPTANAVETTPTSSAPAATYFQPSPRPLPHQPSSRPR